MNNLRTPKSGIIDASLLFKEIVKDNGLSNKSIAGWEKEIILPFMMDKKGWIGTLMLKSDELAVMLFGRRIWDVVYTADKHSVDGILPVSRNDKLIKGQDIQSYINIPHCEAGDHISKSMHYLICNLALKHNINEVKNSIEILPVVGFYETNGELTQGSVLPFPNETIVSAQFLNKFICDLNNNKVLEKTKDLEFRSI